MIFFKKKNIEKDIVEKVSQDIQTKEMFDNGNSSSISPDNHEIIAVIAAALASMESGPGIKLEVKAIRRIPQTSPVWNLTGRQERLSRNLNA